MNIVLRFRDLITEKDGTINDHYSIINRYGGVWWGWWMKQDETPPTELFKKIAHEIDEKGYVYAYLFDTGLLKLYRANMKNVLVAPHGNTIGTPDPEKSPSYYHRGRYPAWFLFEKIMPVSFDKLKMSYHSFPTRPESYKEYKSHINNEVVSLSELKGFDITMWVVSNK